MSRNARRRRMERRMQRQAKAAIHATPGGRPVPGVCRYCQCTELHACRTAPNGEPCCWADDERTVCSNAPCLQAWARDRRIATEELADQIRRREYWRMTREMLR